jgi:hypothetical protein
MRKAKSGHAQLTRTGEADDVRIEPRPAAPAGRPAFPPGGRCR